MAGVAADHDMTDTLKVEVIVPGHEPRTASAIFSHTRTQLLERDGAICWICCGTPEQVGPLEAHHCYCEWSFANAVDWDVVKHLCDAGDWGFTQAQRDAAKAFDWSTFDPTNPYTFVDNMLVNGLLLCKAHHTGADSGIHMMDHPRWIAQRILRDGYKFSASEVIHHQYQVATPQVSAQ